MHGHFGERIASLGNQMTRVFDPLLTKELADCDRETAAEFTGQVHSMHACNAGYFSQGQWSLEM